MHLQKRKWILCILAVFAAFLSSCTRSLPAPSADDMQMSLVSFQPCFQPGGSKTHMGDFADGVAPVLWDDGDVIAVIPDRDESHVPWAFEYDSASGKFQGTLPAEYVGANFSYTAVYPFGSYHGMEDGYILYETPSIQIAQTGSFGAGVNTSVAKSVYLSYDSGTDSYEYSLTFRNLCSYVYFDLQNSDITSISLKSNNSHEYLAVKNGMVKLDRDGHVQELSIADESSVTENQILLQKGGDVLEKGTYYIALALNDTLDHKTILSSFSLTLTQQDGKKAKKSTNNMLEVDLSHARNLGSLNLTMDSYDSHTIWDAGFTPDGNIWRSLQINYNMEENGQSVPNPALHIPNDVQIQGASALRISFGKSTANPHADYSIDLSAGYDIRLMSLYSYSWGSNFDFDNNSYYDIPLTPQIREWLAKNFYSFQWYWPPFITGGVQNITLSKIQLVGEGMEPADDQYHVYIDGRIQNGTVRASVNGMPADYVQPGDPVKLELLPDTGYRLAENGLFIEKVLPGGVDYIYPDQNGVFAMPACDVSIWAEFELIPIPHSVLRVESVGGEIHVLAMDDDWNLSEIDYDDDEFLPDTQLFLEQQASDGYRFAGWNIRDEYGTPVEVIVWEGLGTFFNMPDSDVTVEALFQPVSGNGYTLDFSNLMYADITAAVNGVPINIHQQQIVEAGAEVSLSIAPHSGYELAHWTVNSYTNETGDDSTRWKVSEISLSPWNGATSVSFVMPQQAAAVSAAVRKSGSAYLWEGEIDLTWTGNGQIQLNNISDASASDRIRVHYSRNVIHANFESFIQIYSGEITEFILNQDSGYYDFILNESMAASIRSGSAFIQGNNTKITKVEYIGQ